MLVHMELELGLALPTQNPNIDGFDLNNSVLINSWRPSCGNSESKKHVKNNKRSFEESFLKPLPLLVWSGQPNEEEDDGNGKDMQRNIHTPDKNNEEENNLVGWPPIKSWWRKELHQQQGAGGQIRNDRMQVNVENRSRRSNPLYVKVNMEGVAIGRKINLRLYNSYHTLTNTLLTMFSKYEKSQDTEKSYTLTFQNRQGDWLLTRQVPWQFFIATVRRLMILREK